MNKKSVREVGLMRRIGTVIRIETGNIKPLR